jgi:isopentenyl-diphosphate delta-isomerase
MSRAVQEKSQLVILVDKNNRKIGIEEKMRAHIDGRLHRAFSIFIFNSKGELLLQQRAKSKYHSSGLWSNTVCSHPRPGENYQQAVHRRLKEEMGFNCELKKLFSFIYKTDFGNGLIENEYDSVFMGKFDGQPNPNATEVMDYKWIDIKDLKKDVAKNPERYSVWLKIILDRHQDMVIQTS